MPFPSVEELLAAWAERVRADRDQVERLREVADPADFYAPVAERFRHDPRRTDDPTLAVLRAFARPDETWLDIGAGGGRFALPMALLVCEVIAVEPSVAMIDVFRSGMAEHAIANVTVVASRWPLAPDEPPLRADVSLMAHVGYDIEAVGPFLDAMESATRRLCVAVMGEGAMTTIASRFWAAIHGEPRVALPALPELVTLLLARRALPEVRLVDRPPALFDSRDDVLAAARRQLWVRAGSDRRRAAQGTARRGSRAARRALDTGPAAQPHRHRQLGAARLSLSRWWCACLAPG